MSNPPKAWPFDDEHDVVVDFFLDRSLASMGSSDLRCYFHWSYQVNVKDEQDRVTDEIGYGDAVVIDLSMCDEFDENPYVLLDSIEGDIETIAAAVFDPSTGEFVPELEDDLAGIGSSALLLNRLRFDPRFRGMGLGPPVVAVVIDTLGRGCSLAACYPAPFDGEYTDEERARAIESLGKTWAKVGFSHFRSGVWTLDLGKRTFGDAYSELSEWLDEQRATEN